MFVDGKAPIYSPRSVLSLSLRLILASVTERSTLMAKGQKKSNKEVRKPKADKTKPKLGAPVAKPGDIKGMEHLKR